MPQNRDIYRFRRADVLAFTRVHNNPDLHLEPAWNSTTLLSLVQQM
jgi:hypothetical protein